MFEATLRSGVTKIRGMVEIEGEDEENDAEDETPLDLMASGPPPAKKRKALTALYKSKRPPGEKA